MVCMIMTMTMMVVITVMVVVLVVWVGGGMVAVLALVVVVVEAVEAIVWEGEMHTLVRVMALSARFSVHSPPPARPLRPGVWQWVG